MILATRNTPEYGGKKMYQVYVKSKGRKWVEYSAKFKYIGEATTCKENAENRRCCDVNGNLYQYKIVEA